jgi:hypothetical protein
MSRNAAAEPVLPSTVTDALRRQVREELPEVALIGDQALQAKVVEAWAYAIANSSFPSIRDIPPAGNPDVNEAKRGDQTDHLRGVTRLAIGIAKEMGSAYPELEVLFTMWAKPGNSTPSIAIAGSNRKSGSGVPPCATPPTGRTSA